MRYFSLLISLAFIASLVYGFSGGDFDTNDILSSVSFSSGPSIQELSVNASGYIGKNVTVTGEAGSSADSTKVQGALRDDKGYTIGYNCKEYLDYFQPYETYTITGQVKSVDYQGMKDLEVVEKTQYYIECSKPPK